MTPLEQAVHAGQDAGKLALYFGAWNRPGHGLHLPGGPYADIQSFALPWTEALMDCTLLRNGKHADKPDGRVWWTCGGARHFWYAFFWWDRSGDSRPGSNSGLYVRGFSWKEPAAAFEYGCGQFPRIIARQRNPLVLQP